MSTDHDAPRLDGNSTLTRASLASAVRSAAAKWTASGKPEDDATLLRQLADELDPRA